MRRPLPQKKTTNCVNKKFRVITEKLFTDFVDKIVYAVSGVVNISLLSDGFYKSRLCEGRYQRGATLRWFLAAAKMFPHFLAPSLPCDSIFMQLFIEGLAVINVIIKDGFQCIV